MHHYFHSEGFIDLDAIRKDANWRLRVGYHEPEESVIHLHRAENIQCPVDQLWVKHNFVDFGTKDNRPGPILDYATLEELHHEWYTFDMLEE